MNTIYVVEVNESKGLKLPDSCIVCGLSGDNELKTITLSDEQGRVDFYLYGFIKTPGEGFLLKAPVHDKCAKGVRNNFLKRLLLIIIVASAIVTLGIIRHFGMFFSVVIALVVITVFLYFLVIKPVPMEFIYKGKKYFLMFKDRTYAEHVARLNGSEVRESSLPFIGFQTDSLKKAERK